MFFTSSYYICKIIYKRNTLRLKKLQTWEQTYFLSMFLKFDIEEILRQKMTLLTKHLYGFLHRSLETKIQVQQVRHQFVDWRMLKDYRKRLLVKKHGEEKLRLTALKKNKILPPELRILQAIAEEEINALPRHCHRTMLVARCVVTSRPKGVVGTYRVSRMVFRHLADYNCLSGWERAMW